ncbi:MAG: type II methionyl aminopeptidase [Candidatus Thermoplasmatota archaeon]|nr:type II methionyl aminopeptidase [Candidatus Thermoplasmatota archaeon]
MNEEIYDRYRQAGEIAKKARTQGLSLIKEKTLLLSVVTEIEDMILTAGAGIAFPVNISINHVAAHYSPHHADTTMFKKGDVVKLDVGAHVDGYIADTAETIEIGTTHYTPMITAVNKALDNAITEMRADISLTTIGKTVETTLNNLGYKPIENLTGHSLQKYELHAGLSVPNVADRFNRGKPQIDDVIAIEPFATNGAGRVISSEGSNIYLCTSSLSQKLVRDTHIRTIYQRFKKEFHSLPFAQRWAEKITSNSAFTLRKMTFLGLLKHYPQLIEANKGIVTQKEHTVIITEQGCEVIT